MLDESSPTDTTPAETTEPAPTRRRRAAKRPAGPPPVPSTDDTAAPAGDGAPAADAGTDTVADAPAAPAKKAAKRAPRKRAAAPAAEPAPEAPADAPAAEAPAAEAPAADEAPVRKTTKRAPRKKAAAAAPVEAAPDVPGEAPAFDQPAPAPEQPAPAAPLGAVFSGKEDAPAPTRRRRVTKKAAPAAAPEEDAPAATETSPGTDAATAVVSPTFQAPDPTAAPVRGRTRKASTRARVEPEPETPEVEAEVEADTDTDTVAEAAAIVDVDAQTDVDALEATDDSEASAGADESEDADGDGPTRRRRRRGGRRRRRGGGGGGDEDSESSESDSGNRAGRDGTDTGDTADAGESTDNGDDEQSEGGTTRRRRRRRRRGEGTDLAPDDPANTVVRVREPRNAEDEITSITGSTRLEAKKQRRREGRDAGRRRAPIVSESEFLARRESVKREMIIRQRDGVAQMAVLEDGVLVEHYVARESQTSLIGNVYLGRVQNVLPSMEAAFVDIGKGRNAVLYAGEVDWKALGVEGRPRKVEEVLKPGQTILVQVTKDPVGHKGARLTGQISLPGRYVVYVPGGQSSGISRKLSDTERSRLKSLLKTILPEEAGVIIRTAAEGATEDQLTRDVSALTARWDDIAKKAEGGGNAPQMLYGEPDLMIKVVRDLFNEDFASLVVQGDDAWDMVNGYIAHVAPDLTERLSRWDGSGHGDVFTASRVDEQIAKGLDRKVFLPSGGSLVIDRTEAMTVVDVNTGKFTGSGGNLEETVTKNNLEAAEEIVRQLRLRDIGGIIVIDFIDMVLENNRDLVLRRLVECLGRDRTRHQVAEVTSLGLVQMTRKKIGTGLLEAFSEPCEHCNGRGVTVHAEPIEPGGRDDSGSDGGRKRSDGGSGQNGSGDGNGESGGRRGRRGGRGRSGRSEGEDADVTSEPTPSRPKGPRPPRLEPVTDADSPTVQPDGSTDTTEQAPEPAPGAEPVQAAEPVRGVRAEEPAPSAEPEQAAQPAPVAEPVQAAEPAPATEPEQPTAPVKRTRRRASRPAAPPAPVAASDGSGGDADSTR